MAPESVHPRPAAAGLFLPADGLSLLGEHPGGGHAGRRFLVSRSDGQAIQLPLLLYLVMAAIAEGSVDGGWSADQVGARVRAASGQGLTADNVHFMVTGTLAPLGLIAADGADRPPVAAPPPRMSRPWQRARRWALALGGIAVLVTVATATAVLAGTGTRPAGGGRPAAGPVLAAGAAAGGPALAAGAAAAASASRAAVWVARQVSQDVTVSCDPGMCLLLRRDGFPAARLAPLPRGAHGPLGAGVVVATPAVRSQLGPRLAAVYAPQVIASFGSGAALIAVRAIAPGGAAAFRAQLAVETTALAAGGRQLLANQDIQASPAARAALRAGRVDARLLAILALLSARLPVRLTGFTAAPGAGPGVPLRAAGLGVASPADRAAVLALLAAQRSPYRPAVTVTGTGTGAGRGWLITLRFDAPAALNMSPP